MEKIVSEAIADKVKFKSFDDERADRKLKLASAFRVFAHYGFDEGIVGQISVRDPEFTDTFWVNPFGLYFGHLCVSDLIRVDMEGNILEGKHDKLNKPAFIILSKIHLHRPDVNSIAHAHTTFGKIFSTTGKYLTPLNIEATAFYNDHALFNNKGGLITELSEGDQIAEALGKKKAIVLKNHGILTVGRTVEEATWWFVSMERACQVQIMSELLGTPTELSQKEAERGFFDTGHPDCGYFQYQPLLQKMLREHPDMAK